MRIGIDCGGTKIEAIALDKDGQTLARHRRPTPKGDYQATLSTITHLVSLLETETKQYGTVGIGIPGVVDPKTRLIKKANTTWLVHRPFQEDIQRSLQRSVRLSNDANCFVVSEAYDGAGRDCYSIFGVILGSGCGSGLVINKRLYEGAQGCAGEWAHSSLPWQKKNEYPGTLCHCGQYGCIETWVSGPGLAADHYRTTQILYEPATIVAHAQMGDTLCLQTLQRFEDRLARSLAGVVNLLDPEVIVLGGGLSHIQRLYTQLPLLLSQWILSSHMLPSIRPAQYGDASGVRGAAWLWDNEEMAF